MPELNRWQRVFAVVAALWIAGVAYHYAQRYPAQGWFGSFEASEYYRDQQRKYSADLKPREAELAACPLTGTCRQDVEKKYDAISDAYLKAWKREFALEKQELSTRQAAFLRKVLAIALLPPLFLYGSVAWILRAPSKSSTGTK